MSRSGTCLAFARGARSSWRRRRCSLGRRRLRRGSWTGVSIIVFGWLKDVLFVCEMSGLRDALGLLVDVVVEVWCGEVGLVSGIERLV